MSQNLSIVWLYAISELLTKGERIAPRGQLTNELIHRTMIVDMRCPVLNIPKRKLNYQFMAAEAYWILSGDDQVDTIAPYNKNISQFSDNGKTFFGAYGPKIVGQLPYVVKKLLSDPQTRQSGLSIWRESPPETKDVPCTVAVFFNIRRGRLNCHVFMRSSDIWLGVPYDVFNFSMLAHLVCCKLNENNLTTIPGDLYLTAASSHLYSQNLEEAENCLEAEVIPQRPTPEGLYTKSGCLMKWLYELRDTKPGSSFLRWWELPPVLEED